MTRSALKFTRRTPKFGYDAFTTASMRSEGFAGPLMYKGLPVEFDPNMKTGEIILRNVNGEEIEENAVWALHTLGCAINGERLWPWSKIIWQLRRRLRKIFNN